MGRLSVVLLWMVVGAAFLVGSSRQTEHYRSCSLGKGLAKLYNCQSKYDLRGSKSVRITDIEGPARYLVKLRHNESAKTVDEICEQAEAYRYKTYSGYCINKYRKVWIGMLMMINGDNLSHMLIREAGSIDHVEVDGTVRVCSGVVQGNPPNWGLDRIDHLPGQDLLNELYATSSTGDGVHVYVLDTGIRCSHKEFYYKDGRLNKTSGLPTSRCVDGFDAIHDGFGTHDCNGHGTHCAGIVGGLTTGVAKDVILHPVRAMSCDGSGTYGAVLASLDWISHNLVRPAVISMSLATQASISIDQAISNLISTTGIIGVAAAGNFLQAACNYSPARASTVISVGSSNVFNQMSWFSNYGRCTTLFAPELLQGEMVYSAYHTADLSYAVLSGTSMACPHVAGTVALYLSQNVDARPSDVKQVLLDATERYGVAYLKPETTTKLLNTNIKQPFFKIHPRNFYDSSENTTEEIVVYLTTKPSKPVTLIPQVNAKIGYFFPAKLVFGTDSTWSLPQKISLVLVHNSDFLNHSSTIDWDFESQDAQFVASPEGIVIAHDTDICQTCGQTTNDPKIVPSLPFYYLQDTSKYPNNSIEKFNTKCHSSGPAVIFQYTATADTVVSISLCGMNTQFDTILTFYEKISNNKTYNLTFIACNDDSCGLQSFLLNMVIQKGHTYIIVVDGYNGANGPVDFYMYQSGAPCKDYHLTETRYPGVPRKTRVLLKITQDFESSTYHLRESQQPKTITSLIHRSYSAFRASSFKPPDGYASSVEQLLPTTIPFTTSSITSSAEDESAICTLWVGANCEVPPAPLPVQAGFFWSPVAWGLCDKACGGGSQQAVMKCFSGNYVEVALSNCATTSQPRQSQVCNMVACYNYSRIDGPWEECSKTCGTGTQKRQVICMDSLGNTANPEQCGGEANFQKEQLCNTHACKDTHWETGLWNYCNLPCAQGQKSRTPTCWSNNTLVDNSHCHGLQLPLEKLDCNSHPCQTFAWLVGHWNTCPKGCNAIKTRQVQCVDGSGRKVIETLCNSANKPTSTIPCRQLGLICEDCWQHNCSSNGICERTHCHCFDGWEGQYCERPTICHGRPIGFMKDGTLGCCPFAKTDNQKQCCRTKEAYIDLNGACCDGILDACGMCNGPHKSIDSQNQCCPTIRDEKGICCASGMLDECYVCDGDGTTCATHLTIITILNNSVDTHANASSNWKFFVPQLMTEVAIKLHVVTEALLLRGVQTMNSVTERCTHASDVQEGCLNEVTTEFLAVFNFTVLPIPLVILIYFATKSFVLSRLFPGNLF